MPQIVQQGALNTTALVVPDLYVVIVPPQNLLINGVPTNVLGVVGTAQWGPVNQPMIVGSMAQYAQIFGSIQNRANDAGTAVAIATLQGAQNFRVVRVTDGTDVAASIEILSTCLDVTAKYTGTLGNGITVTLSKGSAVSTTRVVVGVGGYQPEVFDNIPGSANALWLNVAAALNNGNSITRGPSQWVTATAGAGTTAPSLGTTYTLTSGVDGVASITTAVMEGADTYPRTGMYALRGQGCSLGMLADISDSGSWTTQIAFGLSEGIYMITTSPAGSAIANGTDGTVDLKAAAGADSYALKILHGDWLYWLDTVNQVIRLVSPQAFSAGRLANLSPEQSSLNKQMYGIIGSQLSGLSAAQNTTYTEADLQELTQFGIDVICNPQPGGSYWGARVGHNSSSNAVIQGDNYTRMTNYIASTIAVGLGQYVGDVINLSLTRRVTATLNNFFANMVNAGQLGTIDGSTPYGVVCNATNNPPTSLGLGYLIAAVQVQYMPINEKFLINLEGGQSVQITRQAVTLQNVPATPVQ